ncbi:MAG: hypothetical protein OEX22_00735 [Cyclobacteriaceae bacterium]|nr:hypothetical protein [Cyclobacteriaceae bacterium]
MKKLLIGIIVLSIAACGPSKDEQAQDDFENQLAADSTQSKGPEISPEVISAIIESIPSPLEISVLLKESGTKYDISILNASNNTSKYNSNYSKALNLGIYGTDLGYTNIYAQNQDGLDYMSSIKSMADGLNIGQFFDIETIGKLATNSNNLDSLLLVTTQNFNAINTYLQEQDRSHLSVLLLAGGWLEAMHITCQVSSKNPSNKELQEKIGEQKIILENIVLLLSFYSESFPDIAAFMIDILELQASFDTIEITTIYKESTMEIVDGIMVIHDNSESNVNITDANVEEIKNVTAKIRSKIIS